VACRHLPLGEAHDLVDHVEKEVAETLPGTTVVVHAEPAPECADPSRCARQAGPTELLAHDPPA
jgi:divalent metal cation (Fe/Co/Zn/Cd) transporter